MLQLRQRRWRAALCTLGIAWLLPFSSAAPAEPAGVVEDIDYVVIPERRLSNTEKIEVVYFFYYGCEWCFRFELPFAEWLKRQPPDIVLRRVAAFRNSRWATLTRAFYTLESLKLLPQLHNKLFNAYHIDKADVQSQGSLFDWLASQGVDRARFEETFHSDAVTQRLMQARELTYAFQVQSTPSVAIDGRYLTDSGMTAGVERLIAVVDALVQAAREDRQSRK